LAEKGKQLWMGFLVSSLIIPIWYVILPILEQCFEQPYQLIHPRDGSLSVFLAKER